MSFLNTRDIDYDPPLILRINRGNYDSTAFTGPLLPGQAVLPLTGAFQQPKRAEIGLFSSIVNYGWYNISAAYGNNQFSYSFQTSGGPVTRNLTIPDGNYDIDELNTWFQGQQVANGDFTGTNTVFLSITPNVIQNGTTITAAPVSGIPSSGITPGTTGFITVPTYIPNRYQTSFAILLGFGPGNYPSTFGTTRQSINSNMPTSFFPVQAINVNCNMAGTGNYVQNDSTIYTFTTANAVFGGPIERIPPVIQWFPLSTNQFPNVSIQLTDQLGNLLQTTDNQMQFQLRVRVMTAYNRS